MSVIAGVTKAAAAKVYTGTSPTTTVFPKTKWTLVVMALALLALVVFAVLIPASQAPSAEHSWGREYQVSARRGAGFRAWVGGSDERGSGPRRLREAPALLHPQ